jgi:hypothetical protein
VLGPLVDKAIISKLQLYLKSIPKIQVFGTTDSDGKGSIITVVLNKPIPLAEELSLSIPKAKVTEEILYIAGRRGVRRININKRAS